MTTKCVPRAILMGMTVDGLDSSSSGAESSDEEEPVRVRRARRKRSASLDLSQQDIKQLFSHSSYPQILSDEFEYVNQAKPEAPTS